MAGQSGSAEQLDYQEAQTVNITSLSGLKGMLGSRAAVANCAGKNECFPFFLLLSYSVCKIYINQLPKVDFLVNTDIEF